MPDREAALAVLGEPGWRLLMGAHAAVEAAAGDVLAAAEKLRRSNADAPPVERAAALELVTAGRALARKIGCDERLLAVREAVEQATSGRVAIWHAQQVPAGARLLEIGCGCGADTLALAHRAANLIATDVDAVRAACAHTNLMTLGLSSARVIPGDGLAVLEDDAARADVVFADPDRRPQGARSLDPDSWQPPLSALLALAPERRVFIKAAPSLRSDVVPESFSVSYVSAARSCCEAFVASHRDPAAPHVLAVQLPADGPSVSLSGAREDAAPLPLGGALYVPDPAAVRASLLAELCVRHGLGVVSPGIALLTGDSGVDSPWLTSYEVLSCVALDPASIRGALRSVAARSVRVHVRGVPLDAATLQRSVARGASRRGAGGAIDMFATRLDERATAVVARRRPAR